MNRFTGYLTRFLGQLFLKGDMGQSAPNLRITAGQNQTGNLIEGNTVGTTGGTAFNISSNGTVAFAGAASFGNGSLVIDSSGNITTPGNNYAKISCGPYNNGFYGPNLTGTQNLGLQGGGYNSQVGIQTGYYTWSSTNQNAISCLDNSTISGSGFVGLRIVPTYNQTGSASATDLLVNRTQTAVGSGTQRLLDLQVNGNSVTNISNTGAITGYGAITFTSVQVPTGLAITTSGTAGTTTYGYRVSAVDGSGMETNACTTATTTTGNATLNGTNYNIVTWNSVAGAIKYNVYGRTAGSELSMTSVPSTGAATYTFNDTGAFTPLLALPGNPVGHGVTVQGTTNQTGNLLTLQNSAGGSLFSIDPSGNVTCNPSSTFNVNAGAGNPSINFGNGTQVNAFNLQTTGNAGFVNSSGNGMYIPQGAPASCDSAFGLKWGASQWYGTMDTGLYRASAAVLQVTSGTKASAAGSMQLAGVLGSPGSGMNSAGANLNICGGVSTGTAAGGSIIFQTSPASVSGASANTPTTGLTLDSNQNVAVGTGAVATSATNGFLYIPTCAGAPSGTPTAKTGLVPIVFDSTDNKIYVYTSGAWKGTVVS